jgi:hypothetical protein
MYTHRNTCKGKAIPVQVWADPEVPREGGFHISIQSAHYGGKALAAFTLQEILLAIIFLEAESTPGP